MPCSICIFERLLILQIKTGSGEIDPVIELEYKDKDRKVTPVCQVP